MAATGGLEASAPTVQGPRLERGVREPSPAGYWWGALLIVVGAVVGAVLLMVGLRSALNELPTFSAEFDTSPSGVVVTAPAHWAVYARARELPAGTCTITPANGRAAVSPASASVSFSRGAGSWIWVDNVDATGSGTFGVACPAGHYAVGEQPHLAGFAAGIAGGVLGLIVPLLLGIGGGGTVIVATAVRRARARNGSLIADPIGDRGRARGQEAAISPPPEPWGER